jgi:polyisoprenoid-binding protein YceI
MKKIKIFLTFFAVLAGSYLQAQNTFQVEPSSEMVIKGTSSIHDWTSEVETVKGKGMLMIESGNLKKVSDLNISIPVKSIKSGKNAMDKNTYEALKAEDHPEIKFNLLSLQDMVGNKITATGEITIGGSTKKTELTASYDVKEDGKIALKGEKSLKMSEFNIDPPTAMFGTIKTGDEITIEYNLILTRQ